jgi:glycosyltransferase involved in cell wall biosynthesis
VKALFPLPLVYDGNESRFLQRDGARFAAELNRRGDIGVKLIIDDGAGHPKPKSPLLDTASWQDWISPQYWADTHADLILLYGGFSRNLLPVAQAIKQAKIPFSLKMDSAARLLPHWHTDFWRLIRTNYHVQRQRHGKIIAMALMLRSRLIAISGMGTRRLTDYFGLFDFITVESTYALENTQAWLRKRGCSHLADRVKLLPHPIPDHFVYDPATDTKANTIIAVAQDWTNQLKGGTLLADVLAHVLQARNDYQAIIVGGASDEVRKRFLRAEPTLASQVSAIAKIDADQTKALYASARILITTSGSESGPLVAYEAACCGCSVVFPPELKHLNAFVAANSGRQAGWRSTRHMAQALLDECSAWDARERDPVAISGHWSQRSHTSACMNQLYAWLEEIRRRGSRDGL